MPKMHVTQSFTLFDYLVEELNGMRECAGEIYDLLGVVRVMLADEKPALSKGLRLVLEEIERRNSRVYDTACDVRERLCQPAKVG